MERDDRRILIGCIIAVMLALALVVAYLGRRVLDIDPREAGKVLLAAIAGIAIGIPLNWVKRGVPWAGRKWRDFAAQNGLKVKGHTLRGDWNGRRVVVRLARGGGPSVLVGAEQGGTPWWDVTERRLEELLVERKERPAPTGDAAFDKRFVWRPEGTATLSPQVRKALLARPTGNPDLVEAWSAGLQYSFNDDRSVSDVRAALEGATALADALGLPRDAPM